MYCQKMYGGVKVKLQVLALTPDEREWSKSCFTFLSPKAEPKIETWLSPADSNFSVAKKKCLLLAGLEHQPKL
jgi:hypothetical protein